MCQRMQAKVASSAFALGLSLLMAPPGLWAATLTYPGAPPCDTTLQLCVTGAIAGDTIQLATNTPIAEFVIADKSLTIEPAPGFAPSVQGLFASATVTDVTFTVQNLAGLNQVRTVLAPGGGGLTLNVLNNTIDASSGNSAVEFTAGTGGPGPYGTATALVSGNQITMNGAGSCADAVAIIGVPAGFAATVVDNDITVNNLSQCGGIVAVIGGGAIATATIDRNLVHGVDFDFGIEVRNFGSNPGVPGGLLTAQVTNNLVFGQNGNTGAPAGLVASADGNNAGLAVQMVNNTVADGRTGVLISARTDLGADVTGGLFNNVVAFHSQTGISIDDTLVGFSNSNNLVFSNAFEFFVPGPDTLTTDPQFANRPGQDYRLGLGSPALESGLDSALPPIFVLDLDGGPRRVGIIDRGAYEADFVVIIPTLQPGALAAFAVLLALSYLGLEFRQRRARRAAGEAGSQARRKG